MVSTLGDLVTWGKALATGTLLSKGLRVKRLRFGTIPNNGPPVGYGLGILRVGNWIGHDGAIFGFTRSHIMTGPTARRSSPRATSRRIPRPPTATLFGLIAQRLYPASLR